MVLLAAAVRYGLALHRGLGFGMDERVVVARTGVLFRSWAHLGRSRVQSVSRSASPFQRRLGLETLAVAHARGAIAARDRDPADETAVVAALTAARA